jgi:hypothetical protein
MAIIYVLFNFFYYWNLKLFVCQKACMLLFSLSILNCSYCIDYLTKIVYLQLNSENFKFYVFILLKVCYPVAKY